jgi:spore germination protein YaaH
MQFLVKKLLSLIWPLFLGVLIGLVAMLFYSQKYPEKIKFLSPLGSSTTDPIIKVPSKKPVIGFLPYWTIRTAQIQYHLLDYLAYFSVELNADGSIKKLDKQNANMGWHHLNGDRVSDILKTAKKNGVKTMIVIAAFENEIIDNLITNQNSKNQAIKNIVKIVEEHEFDAVNIDFEYNMAKKVNTTDTKLYAQFIDQLRRELQAVNPKIHISLDLYANAFIKSFPYNIKELEPVVDHLILMGYDFHQASSTNAGPVAPLRSNTGRSIMEAVEATMQKGVNLDKVVLALPFYGYEWRTVDSQYAAQTYPNTGAMASYSRVHALIKTEELKHKWDFQAMSPWLVYETEDEIRQIYFENDESIGLKLQLVNQAQLGGIAIWALGYEGQDASVWSVVEDWRHKQN